MAFNILKDVGITPKLKIKPKTVSKEVWELFESKVNVDGIDPLQAIDEIKETAKRQHYDKLLNNQKRDKLMSQQQEFGDAGKFITSSLTKNMGEAAPNSNVEYKTKAIEGMLLHDFVGAGEAMRTTHLGLSERLPGQSRQSKVGDDVIRALYDPNADVSPEAKQFAKNWAEMAERAKLWFNRVGGDIKDLDNWHLPQSHNKKKVKGKGKTGDRDAWITFITPKLNIDEMGVKADELKEVLEGVWETITTSGMNKLLVDADTGGAGSGKKLSNTRQESRFLKFNNAEDQIAYNARYGTQDVYTTMIDHIRSMSNDIALMEIFGTNPEATFKDLQTIAKQKGQSSSLQEKFQQNMFNVISGRVDQDVAYSPGDEKFSATMGGARSLKVGGVLGSAMISALSDPVFTMVTAGYNSLNPAKVFGKGLASALREMIPLLGTGEKVKLAARLGLGMDAFTGSLANGRYAESSAGRLNDVAGAVLRASGLTAWTNGWRAAFGVEFMGALGDAVGKNLDDLGGFGQTIKNMGFNQEEWDLISAANAVTRGKDGGLLDPIELGKNHPNLAARILEKVQEEIDYAVIMPDARIRAVTTGGMAKGTLGGETARSMSMFKSFPLAVMTLHIGRTFGGAAAVKGGRIGYAAATLGGTTLVAMGILWLREALQGKTPREVSPKFVVEAMMQGGGLGIFGDLIFQDTTRYGNGLVSTLTSPLLGDLETVQKLILNHVRGRLDGKEPNTASGVARFIQTNLPGQNLWYTRLLFDRYLMDHVKSFVDPKYHRKIRNQTRKMKKDHNQEWWWKPGT